MTEGVVRYEAAVLTAMPIELDAVLNACGPWETLDRTKPSPYTFHQATTSQGLPIVAASATNIGQLGAALLAKEVINRFLPRTIWLTGIAAGLQPEVRLGDILIADQVVDYELGKVTSKGFSPRWSVYRCDPWLVDRLRNIRMDSDRVLSLRTPDDSLPSPRIHVGVVLSGNKVIADETTAGALRSVWTKAAGLEMEGAGVAAAIEQCGTGTKFIMVKGVCDYADSKKDDLWQPYAAALSAVLTAEFLDTEFTSADSRKLEMSTETDPVVSGVDPRALRFALSEAFDLSELRQLSFDLGVDWEEIGAGTKSTRIINLVLYLERRGQLGRLLELIRHERPGLIDSYSSPTDDSIS